MNQKPCPTCIVTVRKVMSNLADLEEFDLRTECNEAIVGTDMCKIFGEPHIAKTSLSIGRCLPRACEAIACV